MVNKLENGNENIFLIANRWIFTSIVCTTLNINFALNAIAKYGAKINYKLFIKSSDSKIYWMSYLMQVVKLKMIIKYEVRERKVRCILLINF